MERHLNGHLEADDNGSSALQRSRAVLAGRLPLVPMDLESWFPAVQLVGWIRQEIECLAWGHPLVQGFLDRHPGYEPKVLLGILAYGCVSGFRTSNQLACVCGSHWPLTRLSNGHRPFVSELVGFRRKNRRLVEHVVGRVYQRAVLERLGPAVLDSIPELRSCLNARARERLDIARHLEATEE